MHDLVWNDMTTLNEYSSNTDASAETSLVRSFWIVCAESNEEICFPEYDAISLSTWIPDIAWKMLGFNHLVTCHIPEQNQHHHCKNLKTWILQI